MVGRLPEPLWEQIEEALPFPEYISVDDRRVIETIVFVLRSGAYWMALHPALGMPCYATVCRRLRLWRKARVWPHIETLLRTQLPDGHTLPWERLGGATTAAPEPGAATGTSPCNTGNDRTVGSQR